MKKNCPGRLPKTHVLYLGDNNQFPHNSMVPKIFFTQKKEKKF